MKSKSSDKNKIQELPSDSEENSNEDEYENDYESFTQSKKTLNSIQYSNDFESKRQTARSNTIKTQSEYPEEFDEDIENES